MKKVHCAVAKQYENNTRVVKQSCNEKAEKRVPHRLKPSGCQIKE